MIESSLTSADAERSVVRYPLLQCDHLGGRIIYAPVASDLFSGLAD